MTRQAEADCLAAAQLGPNDAVLLELAQLYANEERPELALKTLERAAQVSRQPYRYLVSVGEAYLQFHRPQDAIRYFDEAESKTPAELAPSRQNRDFLLRLALGRAAGFADWVRRNAQ
jgi:tetratricopeptide (TPR) repeat protein